MSASSARRVRLAAIQDAPVSFSLSESIAKFATLVEKAASAPHNADILVFPEAFLSSYPRGHDFGAVIGSRTDEGREWFRRYYESSLDIDGDSEEWREVRSIVKRHSVIVVLGVIEKDPSRHGSLFCTAVTIGTEGELLAKHRKLLPTASERLVWGQGDGSGIQVAETGKGKVLAELPCHVVVRLIRLVDRSGNLLGELRPPPTCRHVLPRRRNLLRSYCRWKGTMGLDYEAYCCGRPLFRDFRQPVLR